jgi:hypothetical protein
VFVVIKFKILSVGGQSRELAPDRVVEALFTTIGCRLEPQGQGTRFPAVMEDLYSGYLAPGRAAATLRELQEIEDALRKIPVSDVVWSLADLRRGDDAKEAVNHRAANAFDYFVDIDGRPLIWRLSERRDALAAGVALAALGFGWTLLGRALVPRWVVTYSCTDKGGIPILDGRDGLCDAWRRDPGRGRVPRRRRLVSPPPGGARRRGDHRGHRMAGSMRPRRLSD